MTGIYKITSPTGRIYIGQSTNISLRFAHYKSMHRIQRQRKIYHSLVKYGYTNHDFKVIHELPDDTDCQTLTIYEQLYIDQYRNCEVDMMNLRDAGIRGKMSEETRKRMSQSHTGTKSTIEARKKISLSNARRTISPQLMQKLKKANTGRIHTVEEREKRRQTSSGRILTAQARAKISASKIGVKRSDATKEALRTGWNKRRERANLAHIVRVSKSGEEKIYPSIVSATYDSNTSRSAIGNVLLGTTRTAGGYFWKRQSDHEN